MKTLASFLLIAIFTMLVMPISVYLGQNDTSPGEVTYLIQNINKTIEKVTIKLDSIERAKSIKNSDMLINIIDSTKIDSIRLTN